MIDIRSLKYKFIVNILHIVKYDTFYNSYEQFMVSLLLLNEFSNICLCLFTIFCLLSSKIMLVVKCKNTLKKLSLVSCWM